MNRKLDDLWLADSHDFSGARKHFFVIYSSLLATLCFAALAVPEKMYITMMAHDVMIFLDGIYRVDTGQIPHIDFVSPLGPFIYYFPLAVGYLPGLGTSLPDALAVLSLLAGVAAAYVAITRMNFTTGLLFVTSVTLLVAAPVVPGSSSAEVTFAMFYNRIGYAGVMLVMVFLLPARAKVSALLEASLIGTLGLVLLNIKITYFVAWVGILFAVTFVNPTARVAALGGVALASTCAVALAAWMPDMYLGYFHDLREAGAAKVGGGTIEGIWKNLKKHGAYFAVILWAAWFVAKGAYQSKQSRLVFVGSRASILIGSIVLFVMNAQSAFLVRPETALLILAVMEYRSSATASRVSGLFALLCLVALFKLLPQFDSGFSVLNKYFRKSSETEVSYPFYVAPELSNRFVIREGRSLFASFDDGDMVGVSGLRALMLETGPRQEIFQDDYLYSLSHGVVALQALIKQHGGGTVMTMDFSNPFSFLLGLRPPSGDYLWYHDGVNVAPDSMREAEYLFADIRYVMVPVIPANLRSRDFLWDKYGDYVMKNYRRVGNDALWSIWLRRE